MRMLALLMALLFGNTVRADDYYCMFFATDSIQPQYCHVWGTFVHMKDKKLVKEVTISWHPVGGWTILDRKREGWHMSLEESMAMSRNKPTLVWGPFAIEEDLYKKAKNCHETAGNYKMIDNWSRPAMNCIHKLCEITGKRMLTHVRYGKFGAVAAYRHYNRQNLLYDTPDKDLVVTALGLNKYKLKFR